MLVVGLGSPRIEDFSKDNKQVGVKAAPASDDDSALKWLIKNRAEVEKFVADGGSVLILPVQSEKDVAWLPFSVKLEKMKFFAAKPGDFFRSCPIGPADLYYRRADELFVLSGLPEGSVVTAPAVLARVPHKKGEFIFAQVQPKLFYGNWAESKITRVLSAVLTDRGISDRLDLDMTLYGYQRAGFPYMGSTLYFDPFLSTSW